MKRILALLLSILCLAALYTGCGAQMQSDKSTNEGNASGAQSSAGVSSDTAMEMSEAGESNGEIAGIVSDRKIIVRIDYRLETKEFETLIETLQLEVKNAGGYVEQSSVDTSDTSRIKSAEYVVRIPVGKLDGFTGFVESSANVLHKSQSGEDVTVEYFDTETRLNALKIQQERVTALLEQATKMSDILEIESELTRIRTEIEELTTMLRRLDNLTEYATVTLSVSEVDVYEPVAGDTFGAKLQEAMTSSLHFFWEAIQVICIVFVWLLPILVVAAVVVVVILLIRRSRRKQKARNMQVPKNDTGADDADVPMPHENSPSSEN